MKNKIRSAEVKEKIKKVFERMAALDAGGIILETHGHKVTLRVKVHSLKEKEELETAAYKVSGVYDEKNELKAQYSAQ